MYLSRFCWAMFTTFQGMVLIIFMYFCIRLLRRCGLLALVGVSSFPPLPKPFLCVTLSAVLRSVKAVQIFRSWWS